MNKKYILLLLSLFTLTISGCNDINKKIDSTEMELIMKEHSLPLETEILLLDNQIIDIYILDEEYYVVYQKDDGYNLAALDAEFTILYRLDEFGYIFDLNKDDKGQLIVSHLLESRIIDIINSDGVRVISMDVSSIFYTSPYCITEAPFNNKNYISLEEDYYLYVKENEDDRYQIIKSNGTNEIILYEYYSEYTKNVYMLANDTLVLSYKNSTDDLDTLIHIDLNGDIIHQEQVKLMSIKLLNDGYLLELFGEGASYSHIRRNVDSVGIWEYNSQYLTLREEHDDYLLFNAHSNNQFDEIKIYNDGTYTTSIKVDEIKFPEYMRMYVNDDTFLHIDYFISDDGLYHVELYTKEEELIKTIDYTYYIEETIKDNMLYIYGYDGEQSVIDIYDHQGGLIKTDFTSGEFVSLTSDGNYISILETGVVIKTNTTGSVLWVVDSISFDVAYFEVNDSISMIREINRNPYSAFPIITYGATLIIDINGKIITELSDHNDLSYVFNGENSFYMYANEEKILYMINSNGEISQEIDILCSTNDIFFSISNHKLIVYKSDY